MRRIVYHGTLAGKAPHMVSENQLFHAGTKESALDRILHKMEDSGTWDDEYIPGSAQIHAYEIQKSAPMSKRMFGDPNDGNPVPEGNIRKIHRYWNNVEDPGSTSLVIPTKFVGDYVRHLGPQFSNNLDNVINKAKQYITDVEHKSFVSSGYSHVAPMTFREKEKLYDIYKEVGN